RQQRKLQLQPSWFSDATESHVVYMQSRLVNADAKKTEKRPANEDDTWSALGIMSSQDKGSPSDHDSACAGAHLEALPWLQCHAVSDMCPCWTTLDCHSHFLSLSGSFLLTIRKASPEAQS
ncbi:hypothetical protein BaRGS_00015634, partial [Batillaria attramentaria]